MASAEAEKSCSAHLQARHRPDASLASSRQRGEGDGASRAWLRSFRAASCSQQAEAAAPPLGLMKIELLFYIQRLYLMTGALAKDCLLYSDLQRTIRLPRI